MQNYVLGELNISENDGLYDNFDMHLLINAHENNIIVKNKEDKFFKSINIKMDDYLNNLANDMFKTLNIHKKKKKQTNHEIPSFNNCDSMLENDYNIKTLKYFAKHYHLKVSGIKPELYKRIFVYLKLSSKIIKLQKIFRGYLQRKCNRLRGPTFVMRERNKSTNDSDFLTGDYVQQIPYNQYFSYTDNDNFIYAFDMLSFYNLYTSAVESKKPILNPYNRLIINEEIISNMRQLIKISSAIKNPINIKIAKIDISANIDMRINNLFQLIDSLGNYSQTIWFTSLNKLKLLKFIRELKDIWDYRAQLLPNVKINICPPNGDPFRHLNIQALNNRSVNDLKQIIIEVLERLINTNTDREYQTLGSYYILGALTLVNDNAAISLSWLHQSFYIG